LRFVFAPLKMNSLRKMANHEKVVITVRGIERVWN